MISLALIIIVYAISMQKNFEYIKQDINKS